MVPHALCVSCYTTERRSPFFFFQMNFHVDFPAETNFKKIKGSENLVKISLKSTKVIMFENV